MLQDTLTDQLRTLIQLLSDDSLDEAETQTIIDIAIEAKDKPEPVIKRLYGSDAAQIITHYPAEVVTFILGVELEDYLIVANTVDELWEETIDCFENPQLAEFPYDDMPFDDVEGFYNWADAQLLAHHANYALIEFGQHYNYEFQLVLVKRDKLDQVIDLCRKLGIHAQPCA